MFEPLVIALSISIELAKVEGWKLREWNFAHVQSAHASSEWSYNKMQRLVKGTKRTKWYKNSKFFPITSALFQVYVSLKWIGWFHRYFYNAIRRFFDGCLRFVDICELRLWRFVNTIETSWFSRLYREEIWFWEGQCVWIEQEQEIGLCRIYLGKGRRCIKLIKERLPLVELRVAVRIC